MRHPTVMNGNGEMMGYEHFNVPLTYLYKKHVGADMSIMEIKKNVVVIAFKNNNTANNGMMKHLPIISKGKRRYFIYRGKKYYLS